MRQNYIRAETLTRSNASLVAAQNRIPLAHAWGGGDVASADGLRFVGARGHVLQSRLRPVHGPERHRGPRHAAGQPGAALRKYFSHELALGMAEANAKVAKALFDAAIGGNVTAMIFWAKARMGWRAVTVIDATLRDVPAGLASDAMLEAIAFSGRTTPDEDPDEED